MIRTLFRFKLYNPYKFRFIPQDYFDFVLTLTDRLAKFKTITAHYFGRGAAQFLRLDRATRQIFGTFLR